MEALTRDGTVLGVLADGLTIGRGPECGLQIDAPSVSREHALVRGEPGRWRIEDRGSRNGTHVGAHRVGYGNPHPIRDGDVLRLGAVELVVRSAAGGTDPDRTETLDTIPEQGELSAFQRQVVQALAAPWLAGGEPASNDAIAAALGTPRAGEAVKAALRRAYARTGLTDSEPHAKRRELCRMAQRNGWLNG